jgi:prevent-host-death family protein
MCQVLFLLPAKHVNKFVVAQMYIWMYILIMAKTYSIAEARSNLPKIVDQAAAGAEVELTRRGKPVVVIISHHRLERLRSERPRFGDVYRAFLQKHSLKEVGIEDSFFQAVRDRGAGRKVTL